MLQLQTKAIDICRISKLLVKHNIKASITDSVITLDGDVSDELLTQLCGGIDINVVQNFISQEPLYVPKETSVVKSEKSIHTETMEESERLGTTQQTTGITLSHQTQEYNLIYSKVKYGELYWCDLGIPYGSEQGGMRPVIVVQNDDGNEHSPTTIVIACSTANKNELPVHYQTVFSEENIIDYDSERVSAKENVIMAEQIFTVDKARLRKYMGRLTTDFMKIIQERIEISLYLSRKVKIVEKKVYVDRTIPKNTMVDSETPKERKDVNMVQVQLLSFVDINELLKVSQSSSTDEMKAKKILELFGFDFNKNGVQLLLKAIIVSPKNDYFNLETLSEKVSRIEGIDREETKRLIVARVKEKFALKKAPTIDFIRLVNNFLVKQEV